MKITHYIKKILVIMMFLGYSTVAHAAAVKVSWQDNQEADLAGYKIYYGTSSRSDTSYTTILDVNLENSVNISSLNEGTTYYFAVTAYDTTGNESDFSEEVSILIPIPEEDEGNDDPVDDDEDAGDEIQGGDDGDLDIDDDTVDTDQDDDGEIDQILDTDSDGIPDEVENSLGLDYTDPKDSLKDFDGDGVVNLVEYMAGTSLVNASSKPATDDVLKDIVGEIGWGIDLSMLNPDGLYSIIPMYDTYPVPFDNSLRSNTSGTFLYNVYDEESNLIYRLRVSIANEISVMGEYEPGFTMSMEDESYGIGIDINSNALPREVPLAIGLPGSDSLSALGNVQDGFEFDLLPYGLSLGSPATVSVYFEGENPVAQRYDMDLGSWVTIDNVDAAYGVASFSTKKLGKIRIYSEEDAPIAPSAPVESDESGGGCFINTAGF